jgi:arylsulfatase A-like enzyme
MPTVLELVGLPAPRNCDGHSLLPFCAGETPTGWRDEVCWSFDFRDIQTRHMEQAFGLPSEWCNLQVMRTDKLKYVHFAGLPPVVFDLADDPHELTNRADIPPKHRCA